MSRYIKSELYRLLRVKGTYLFVLISSLLLISSSVLLASIKLSDNKFPYATTGFSISLIVTSFIMILFLCIMVSNIVFSNEYSNHTMKNSISFGMTRSTLYFGKLIVQIIYACIAFVLIIGIHVLSAYMLLENSGLDSLYLLFKTCLICLPLFLFSLALTNCFAFAFEGTGATIGSTIGVLFALPMVSNMLGMKFEVFRNFSKILPYNMINNLKLDVEKYTLTTIWGVDGYRNYWIVGLVEMVIFVVLGYVLFRKREIK